MRSEPGDGDNGYKVFLAVSSLLNEGCLMAITELCALVLSLLKNPFCITYASIKTLALSSVAMARCRGDIAFHKRPKKKKEFLDRKFQHGKKKNLKPLLVLEQSVRISPVGSYRLHHCFAIRIRGS